MKKNDKEIQRACAFCEYGVPAPSDGSDEELIVCSRRGVVNAGDICRKFRYDLLKREPLAQTDIPKMEKIDI